jgi:hypothetical protein
VTLAPPGAEGVDRDSEPPGQLLDGKSDFWLRPEQRGQRPDLLLAQPLRLIAVLIGEREEVIRSGRIGHGGAPSHVAV